MKRNRVTSPCVRCGTAIEHKASRRPLYCTLACRNESMRSRPRNDPRPCAVCGTVFTPSRGFGAARYCSKGCVWKGSKGPTFNAAVSRSTAVARGDSQRGTGDKGYVKRNGRHEHRVVAEQKIGRALMPGEVVHHIDQDKHNNDPENLLVTTQREHMRLHGFGIPGVIPKSRPWKKRWVKR